MSSKTKEMIWTETDRMSNKRTENSQLPQKMSTLPRFSKRPFTTTAMINGTIDNGDQKVTSSQYTTQQELTHVQTTRCFDNTQYLHSKLRAVYGECTDHAVREAVVQLNTNYSGYMLYFCDTFLDPALEFIKRLQKVRIYIQKVYVYLVNMNREHFLKDN